MIDYLERQEGLCCCCVLLLTKEVWKKNGEGENPEGMRAKKESERRALGQ